MAYLFSEPNAATMIDCDNIPFELDNLSVLICDTNIKHNLADSAYNKRRQVCEDIAKFNNIKLLRKLDIQKLEHTKLILTTKTINWHSCLHKINE